ncbi:MAG: ATP-binding cassette domain-containing protein, partial [Pseudomonadota bacterium]
MTQEHSTDQALLRVQALSVHFKNAPDDIVAAQQVSFDIHANEVFALVGESGSGKSVTAKSIMGLLPYPKAFHPSGSVQWTPQNADPIELLNAPSSKLESLRGNRISIIFQEPLSALNPLHIIRKQLSEVITQHRTIDSEALSRECVSLLEQVQIKDVERILNAYPHQLSGGQRQRIMIAIAIANRPNLLIADEPTTALDVTVQKEILELLVHLKNTLDMSILLITHDLSIVKCYADRVAVMQHGSVIEQNTVSALFDTPEHPYTQALIDA